MSYKFISALTDVNVRLCSPPPPAEGVQNTFTVTVTVLGAGIPGAVADHSTLKRLPEPRSCDAGIVLITGFNRSL